MNAVTNTLPDLSMFDVKTGANKGFQLDLVDSHRAKTGFWIRVLGRDSDEFQKLFKTQNRLRLQRMQKSNSTKMSQEELEDDALELLGTVTKEWNFKAPDGSDYPCTPSNAINLYKAFPYIREQVDMAVGDRENFTES